MSLSQRWISVLSVAQRVQRALGTTGLIGLGLVTGSLAIALVLLPRQQQDIEAARQRLSELQSSDRTQRTVTAAEQQWMRWREYIAALPDPVQAHAIWRSIDGMAAEREIRIEQAQFERSVHADAGFSRVDVHAPLRSEYLPLKYFLAALLNRHKTVALESLTLQRSSATDPAFDIDLRLTMYCRTEAPP